MDVPDHGGQRSSGLPFGAVMATGGASAMGRVTGMHHTTEPLLMLAVAQAVTIAVLSLRADPSPGLTRTTRSDWMNHYGAFTVPVGCATIAAGAAVRPGEVWAIVAVVFGLAAHASTLVLLGTVVARSITARSVTARPGLSAVDGSWFLAPAALLADALVVVAVGLRWSSTVLQPLAVVETALGVVAYLVVVTLAGKRILRHGLGPVPRSPWWIAAGCGGLAAAATGAVSTLSIGTGHQLARTATYVTWIIGTLIAVPVVVASVRYALGHTGFRHTRWPPTFSTAVYALGTYQVARLSGSGPLENLAEAAGYATIALWAVTTTMWCMLRLRAHPRCGP